MMLARTIALAALLCPVAACEEHEDCAPSVELSVGSPTVPQGGTVSLTVRVEDFTLVEPAAGRGQDPGVDPGLRHGEGSSSACEGHYHVYVDDLMTNPVLQDWQPETTLVVEAEPGMHELIVRLNASDHKIVEPEVTDRVTITVE
jgi:hypothetical protein